MIFFLADIDIAPLADPAVVMHVFLLWHIHHVAAAPDGLIRHFETPEDYWADEVGGDDVKLLGVYSSKAKIAERIRTATELEGFSEEPHCFHVAEYELDEDHWTEGFRTMT